MTAEIRIAIALILAVCSFTAGWSWRGSRAAAAIAKQDTITARAETAAQKQARSTEQAAGKTLATIGANHESARIAAQAVPAAVVADLRAGNVRLRNEWQGCKAGRLSDAATATAERDALAASRDALAGDLVRVGRDADDQLRACQAVVLADRAAINGTEAKP